ncbi:hypothetical protein G3M81_03200 [Bacillus paralicheniformis]|nr:hypothetical protein [Bacillus paralicheniformis]QII47809.1 hypothetical protein G3M81_03200 [Bacillus paralicheniformis]
MTFDPDHTNEALKELFGDREWYFSGEELDVHYRKCGERFELQFWDPYGDKTKTVSIFTISETLGSIYPIKYNYESTHVHLPLYFTYLMNFICNDISIYQKQSKISLLLTLSYSDPSNTKQYIQKIRLRPMFKKVIQNKSEGVSFSGRLISEEISNEEKIMAE